MHDVSSKQICQFVVCFLSRLNRALNWEIVVTFRYLSVKILYEVSKNTQSAVQIQDTFDHHLLKIQNRTLYSEKNHGEMYRICTLYEN